MNNQELYHFGVKGMKWGHRKATVKAQSTGKKRYSDDTDSSDSTENAKKKGLSDKQKKALKVGVAVAGTALAAYGAYKVSKAIKDKNFKIALEKGEAAYQKYCKDNMTTITRIASNGRGGTDVSYNIGSRGDWNTISTGSDYRNVISKLSMDNKQVMKDGIKIFDSYTDQAEKDSLGKAAKNVYDYYKDKRRKR